MKIAFNSHNDIVFRLKTCYQDVILSQSQSELCQVLEVIVYVCTVSQNLLSLPYFSCNSLMPYYGNEVMLYLTSSPPNQETAHHRTELRPFILNPSMFVMNIGRFPLLHVEPDMKAGMMLV